MATGKGRLAAAAEGALEDGSQVSPDQESLPGTDHARVKFVGMGWEALEVPELREEVEFVVKARCIGHGEEVLKDTIRKTAKMQVMSVKRKGDRRA